MTKKLKEPIASRTLEIALDYAGKADLVAKLKELTKGVRDDNPMVTSQHPEWLRTRWNCCGGSGP